MIFQRTNSVPGFASAYIVVFLCKCFCFLTVYCKTTRDWEWDKSEVI
jgi:hypothetical protein